MSDNTTPRPWKAKHLIYTGEYAVLCETEHGDRRVDDKSGGFLEADARLIVRAVNAHDDLVAACDHALHKIEQTLAGQYADGAALRATLGPLRAALAKARA